MTRAGRRELITPASAARIAGMVRVAPAADLADVVEQHWVVAWDHRDRAPVTQEGLPDPCVNLAIEPAGVLLHGVTSGRSRHVLAGSGSVVGTKFQPGGFSGFVAAPVGALSDRVLSVAEAFGGAGERLVADLSAAASTPELIEIVTAFLRARRPPPDPGRTLVREVVAAMRAAPAGTRVRDLAAEFGLSPRSLQRLFAQHAGATPKRVLQRFRHQQATDRLAAGAAASGGLARLAAELGYFDQAHFVHDFRAATGRVPSGVPVPVTH